MLEEKKRAFTKAINLGQGEEHQGPALSITIFVCFFGCWWFLLLTVKGIRICNT